MPMTALKQDGVFMPCLVEMVKTRYHEGSVSCYKQKQSYITIHEVPTKQNGRRVRFPTEKVTQKRHVSRNVLFRAGVCLYSRCGQSYFNIRWCSNNWRRGRQRKYRWVKLFVNDTLFLIGCIIKVTLRSVVSLINYGPMELKYNNYLNTGNCIYKMLVCVNVLFWGTQNS